LTEEEHEVLEELCAARGGRSLSEYVRVELLNPARSLDMAPLREMVGSMEQRLSHLEGLQNELAHRVQCLLAAHVAERGQV
jgi:hypothetical protein